MTRSEIKQLIARLREAPAEFQGAVKSLERAFSDLREQNASLSEAKEREAARATAAQHEAATAKTLIEQQRQQLESLTAQLAGKAQKIAALSKIVAEKCTGYDFEMIGDFFQHLAMDQACHAAGLMKQPLPQDSFDAARRLSVKYGQNGTLVPHTEFLPPDGHFGVRQEMIERQKRLQDQLDALLPVIATALQACKRPTEQYHQYFYKEHDQVQVLEGWCSEEELAQLFKQSAKSTRKTIEVTEVVELLRSALKS